LKWLGWLTAALLLLGVCVVSYIYIASERRLRQKYEAPLVAFSVLDQADLLANGRRQAIVHGCTSCHGSQLEGRLVLDDPSIGRIRTPSLTQIVNQYSDAELERLVRRGVKRDGVGLWIMPASPQIADEDLGAIIGYLRTVPEAEGAPAEVKLGPLMRLGIAMRKMGSSAEAALDARQLKLDRTDPMSLGRYLVQLTCTDCHGAKLEGTEFLKAPSLMVVAGYQDEDFAKLMRTGIAVGDRTLGKMTEMGRERFSALTDDEIKAILTYLREFVHRGGSEMP
jgi:cytochrome c553